MPVEVVELSTREPDVAHAVIDQVYAPERPITYAGSADTFPCHLRFATAGSVGADRIQLPEVTRCVLAPVDFFLAATPVDGGLRLAAGRDQVVLRPGTVARYPTDVTAVTSWKEVTGATIRLPLAVLERVAEERLGVPRGDLRFDGLVPVSARMQRAWLALSRFVHAQLTDPIDAVDSPLIQAELADLAAATALATFPNTTMTTGYLPSGAPVAPALVRRAVAFVEANASLPITVSDVARAAGTGPRALQAAFARHLGCTPMAYVRRVRLEAAHRELQAGDPTAGDTVAATARRWGFAKPDRFTTAYRRAYGVTPSHTLRT